MTVVDRFVQAVSHGGAMAKPTLIVIHSAETPLRAGYAKSIAENWFGKSASTSAHFMVDPVETIRMLSDNVVSYAVGPKANGFTLNIEQAGYARFSRAEWTTPEGRAQHRKVGALVRELSDTRGIPLRWATDDQIRSAARGVPGGVCFHDDIAHVLGGTTHTDPIPNYPADLVEQAWGPSPAKAIVRKPRRKKTMYLARDNSSGGVYLVRESGFSRIETDEEWRAMIDFLDDDRDPDADLSALGGKGDTLNANARFVDLVAAVLARPIVPNP